MRRTRHKARLDASASDLVVGHRKADADDIDGIQALPTPAMLTPGYESFTGSSWTRRSQLMLS